MLLQWAANLHEIGLHINASSVHKHSSYIIEHSPLPGFNQEQQLLLSAIVRSYRKKIRTELIPVLTQFKPKLINRLISIFRLAVLFNQKRQDGFITSLHVSADKSQLILTLPQVWLDKNELLVADLESEITQLQKLNIQLMINSE